MSSTITALTSGGGLAMAGDTSGQLELKTNNGTTAVTVDTSQNVGIGTTTPTDTNGFGRLVDLNGTSGAAYYARTAGSSTNVTTFGNYGTDGYISNNAAGNIRFSNAGAERMRIDSSGRVLIGTTTGSPATANAFGVVVGTTESNTVAVGVIQASASGASALVLNRGASDGSTVSFYRAAAPVGTISVTSSATSYNTSSDYRLKENIAPMTGALATVSALKPVTYKWKVDGSNGQGFIAHELQAVVPDCVSGEKDAVDAERNPVYQGIDTSFLVATLTAAIQELNAKVDAQALEIQALKGVA